MNTDEHTAMDELSLLINDLKEHWLALLGVLSPIIYYVIFSYFTYHAYHQ